MDTSPPLTPVLPRERQRVEEKNKDMTTPQSPPDPFCLSNKKEPERLESDTPHKGGWGRLNQRA